MHSRAAEFSCAQLASDPAALRIEAVPAGGFFRDALEIEPNDALDLRVTRVALLRGSCEDAVTGHNLPYAYFRDGWAAARPSLLRRNDTPDSLDRWDLISPGFAGTLDGFAPALAQADRPPLDAGEFAGAFHSGASNWYLGVWRRPGRSVIASYLRNADGTFTTPQILLSSPFPIRSATFWSQIDGITMTYGYPDGSLGVTIDLGDGLLAYNLTGLGLAGPAAAARTTD